MSTVPHRAVTTVLTLVVPAAFVGTTVAVAAAWSADLPDPVAVHFGGDGPDGFSSLAGLIWPSVLATALVALGCWALAFFWGRTSVVRRMAAGTATGLAAFLAALVLGILDLQRGLTDAAAAGDVDTVTGVAIGIGFLAAALGAWLTPGDARQPTRESVPADAPRLPLSADETAAWVALAQSRTILVAGGAATAFVLSIAVLAELWVLALVAVALAVTMLAMARFSVVVDRRGLTARSALGWPRLAVPMDEVTQAEVVDVSPFPEFGGWGYRVGRGGRVGIVLRAGEALLVERTGGRSVVVTVDDAATGAALLNTLAARVRANPPTRDTSGSR
ncbi:DUF1648 domain-containing protein [Cellulomonas sp. URHE0023]|uniref:DUF1648 domain-containing protein n=1 Tax=Cellulomonas sp. URHE0023 TaxID=1380354 RepID=UPI00068B9D7E|nr:DUF1648 domain-containing protein [Cellulomonas sp. URHE0023]